MGSDPELGKKAAAGSGAAGERSVENPISEALFVAAANQAPVPIWVSGTDADRVFFNDAWLGFTGRSLRAEFGDGWPDGVHPDDREACITIPSAALSTRESFEAEYRLRRNDGHYGSMLEWDVPRYDDAARFAGYLGPCVDVTTQVEARAELQRRAAAGSISRGR